MIVRSKNFELKLEEITQEKMIEAAKNETELQALQLIVQWRHGNTTFQFKTSGSTGEPKTISIAKEKIAYSTNATFDCIDPENRMKSTLLCINPSFIGGAMVVFRALLRKLDLFITEPSTKPELPANQPLDLVSMVPLQYESMTSSDLSRFQTILIGGAPFLGKETIGLSETKVFTAYGMTETVSHVALRRLGDSFFSTTGDTEVALTSDGCLQFRGTITDNQWLQTNDLGKLRSSNRFEWLGRRDFIINTGGIKINPEAVEEKLKDQINATFMISAVPNDLLGEKLVLVIEGSEKELRVDYASLSRYEKPKITLFWKEIPRTASDKIDRKKVKQLLSTL